MMRRAATGVLATIDADTGDPHASLVAVASASDGSPTLLLSDLAVHTLNLRNSPRCSLLFSETADHTDPLEGSRVSVTGKAEITECALDRARFLAKNRSAAHYADFADFHFYRVSVERGHFVGGFGRIAAFAAQALILPGAVSRAIGEAEAGIVAHMNEDHADAVALYGQALLNGASGEWRMEACDPEGCDLRLNDAVLRLDFPRRAEHPGNIREIMVELAKQARELARDN